MKTKRLLCLVLATLLTLVSGGVFFSAPLSRVEASTNKITLYPGGTYQAGYYYSKAKSSNKSVVKVSKDGTITAVKAGSANVTFETSYGYTEKYKVTVKAYICPVTFYQGYSAVASRTSSSSSDDDDDDDDYDYYDDDDYSYNNGSSNEIVMEVYNRTSQTFESMEVEYNICDKSGKSLSSDSASLSGVVSGKKAYVSVYLPSKVKRSDCDISKCTAKIKSTSYNPEMKYTDKSDSITTNITDRNSSYYGTTDTWTVKVKNRTNQYVSGNVYVLLLDDNDNIVGVKYEEIYLSGKQKTTESFSIDRSHYPGYDHRRVVPVVYSTK